MARQATWQNINKHHRCFAFVALLALGAARISAASRQHGRAAVRWRSRWRRLSRVRAASARINDISGAASRRSAHRGACVYAKRIFNVCARRAAPAIAHAQRK
jgi:hypothetical protein